MNIKNNDLDVMLKNADPLISGILNNALSEKEIDIKDAVMLFSARVTDL